MAMPQMITTDKEQPKKDISTGDAHDRDVIMTKMFKQCVN